MLFTHILEKKQFSFLLLALPFLFLTYVLLQSNFFITGDDAFISFVYVKNFTSGNGLVFNQGEYVWGFTSPLQVLLLSLIALFGGSPEVSSWITSLLFLYGSSVLLFLLLKPYLHVLYAFIIALYFGAFAPSRIELGLESSLLFFLQLLFLYLLIGGKPRVSAVIGGFSCLVRPDSVLLCLPSLLLNRESRNARSLLFFVLPGIPWLLFTAFYYGTILPQSFYAKQGLSSFGSFLWYHSNSLTTLPTGHLLESLIREFLNLSTHHNPYLQVGTVLLILAVYTSPAFRKCPPLLYALTVFPCFLVFSYGVIGTPKGHDWEVRSAYLFLSIALPIGIFTLLERLGASRIGGGTLGISFCWVISILFFCWTGFHVQENVSVLTPGSRVYPLRTFFTESRYFSYYKIASWLNKKVPPGSSVAAGEVGILKYYADVHIVDLAGIVSSDYKTGGNIHDQLLFHWRPEYLLTDPTPQKEMIFGDLRYDRLQHFMNHSYQDKVLFKKRS